MRNSFGTMKKGQISIVALLSIVGPFILASLGFGWNAMTRSNTAIDRVSEVEGDIKAIKVNLEWLREKLNVPQMPSSTKAKQ